MRTAEEYLQENKCHGMLHLIVPIMKQYAADACREQREICAAHYDFNAPHATKEIEELIKNAPEPKMI